MFHDLDPDDARPIDWAATIFYLIDWVLVLGVIVMIGHALGVDWAKNLGL